ncbi:MAG: DUF4013 domain-containing protein [Planctomycetes bacterium]|nr:DUF4013 domain-containing protein [Planctomycetota bacterium]
MSQGPNSSQPVNPYVAPPPAVAPQIILSTPPSTRTAIEWGESVNFLFREPNWVMTLLLGTVCQFIPVIGPIVLMGYQFEVVIDLTTSQGAGYRPFDFNRFVAYLKRGVWPFLVALITMMVMIPLFYIAMIAVVFAGIGTGHAVGGGVGGVLAVIVGFVGFLLLTALMAVMNLVMQPMLLCAALTQQLGQAFRFDLVRDFISRIGKEMFLAFLFQMLVGWLLLFVGMLACFVGMYPAMIVMFMMQGHLLYQLYELYRARGGEVIPIVSAD